MQRSYPVFKRCFSSIKDSKAYQAVKDFLVLHPTYVQHTRYAPEGSTTPGFRYPAPGSYRVPVVPTTENTDRYFKNDLIQHDTRGMGRDIHVVLSPKMTSLPRDIRACYITTYSLKGNDDKVFEHPMAEIKAGDLDLWTTETEEKVKDYLYDQIGDNVPHPFWEAEAGKIIEDYESKGLPPCPGKMYQWTCPKEMENGLW